MIEPHLADTAPRQHELERIPFFPQDRYQCGPASLATVLVQSGVRVTPADLAPLVYIPERRGSLQVELLAATRRYGRLPYVIDPTIHSLVTELQNNRPVLVLQNLGLKNYPIWHYAVVIGYTGKSELFILRSGTTRRRVMPAARFVRTWENANFWGMVVLRPGEMPSRAEPSAYLRATASFEAIAGAQAALPAYRAGSERWPESLVARFGLANGLHSSGQLAEAEVAYRKMLSTRPEYLPALNNLALILADRGCVTSALATVDQAIRISAAETVLSQTLRQTRREIVATERLRPTIDVCEQSPTSILAP